MPLLAHALERAQIEAPVTDALNRLISGELPLDDWVARVRATRPAAGALRLGRRVGALAPAHEGAFYPAQSRLLDTLVEWRPRMVAMSRLSNLFYVLLGAVAVGAVVAVLAVVGALPDKVERTTVTAPTTADAPQSTNTPASLESAPTSVADIYKQVSGSVVFVSARGGDGKLAFNGQGGGKAASGSGFVIDTAGHIVTNDHVVEDADKFTVRFGEEGDPIPAKLVGKDPSSDLAVLSIDPKAVKGGVKPLQLASANSLRAG